MGYGAIHIGNEWAQEEGEFMDRIYGRYGRISRVLLL